LSLSIANDFVLAARDVEATPPCREVRRPTLGTSLSAKDRFVRHPLAAGLMF
jgi:hypothetical protein